ncbi:hypothetical protein ACA910_008739 [Epithemia clementina (nom. ined.)]
MVNREHNITHQIDRGFQEMTKLTTAFLQGLGDFVVTEIRPGTSFNLPAKLQGKLPSSAPATTIDNTSTTASMTTVPQPMSTSPPRNNETKRTRTTSSPGRSPCRGLTRTRHQGRGGRGTIHHTAYDDNNIATTSTFCQQIETMCQPMDHINHYNVLQDPDDGDEPTLEQPNSTIGNTSNHTRTSEYLSISNNEVTNCSPPTNPPNPIGNQQRVLSGTREIT